MIGLRVGPFEIVERTAFPEPGDWYRARRSGMSQRKPTEVLVRVLPPDASPADRADLQRQFDNLRAVEHARVPIAVAMYEGIGAMAITSVRGVPLTEVIAGRTGEAVALTPATLLDLLLEIAEILQFAHHRDRPHGHLDPGKVWLSRDGTVWVLGFAAGAELDADPAWCPPERARGESAGPATDQWSLAAIGSALITGKVPWRGDDPAAQARQGDPEALVEPVERQWPALARLFRKMLDNRPANRHTTMHQVRQELLALARKAGSTSGRRELAAQLNPPGTDPGADESPDVYEETLDSGASREPRLGDTLTPPDATDEPSDAVVAQVSLEPTPEASEPRAAVPERRSEPGSDPDIPMARTLDAAAAPAIRAPAGKLPAEQIPVVRPDLPGDVPAADVRQTPGPSRLARAPRPAPQLPDQAIQETTGPTMLADVAMLAKAHGIDVSSFGHSDPDALNVSPHEDPKSVSDPPSVPDRFAEHASANAADYEATVLFTGPPVAEDSGHFSIAASGEVQVEVELEETPQSPEPRAIAGGASPTLHPTSDADPAGESLGTAPPPALRPAEREFPTGRMAEPPPLADPGFPRHVSDSMGHEPELGSMHGHVSIRSEPGLGLDHDDESILPVAPLPSSPPVAQRVAFGGMALLAFVVGVWLLSLLF